MRELISRPCCRQAAQVAQVQGEGSQKLLQAARPILSATAVAATRLAKLLVEGQPSWERAGGGQGRTAADPCAFRKEEGQPAVNAAEPPNAGLSVWPVLQVTPNMSVEMPGAFPRQRTGASRQLAASRSPCSLVGLWDAPRPASPCGGRESRRLGRQPKAASEAGQVHFPTLTLHAPI